MIRTPFRILTVFTAGLAVATTGCKSTPGEASSGKFTLAGLFKKKTPSGDEAVAVPSAVQRSPEEAAFLEKCSALGAGGSAVAGRDEFYFSGAELKRIGSLTDPGASSVRSAISAITDYQTQLKSKGISLILVPVPPKAVIYPDKLARDLKIKVKRKKPARLDSTLQVVWETLRQRGVPVVDLTQEFLDNRSDKKAGEIYPRTGSAWSPRAARLAAARIAGELGSGKWGTPEGGSMTTEDALLAFAGPLAAAAGGKAETENLSVRNVGIAADGKMRSVTFSRSGHPLTLLGDDNILAWREANNPAGSPGAFASLADQLAFELKTTPDVLSDRSDGRNAPRVRILRDGTSGRNLLSGTKAVVWILSATEFASADWRKVPLRLEFNLAEPELQLDTSSPKPVSTPSSPAMDSDNPESVPLPQ